MLIQHADCRRIAQHQWKAISAAKVPHGHGNWYPLYIREMRTKSTREENITTTLCGWNGNRGAQQKGCVLLLQRAECTLPMGVGHPGPRGYDRFREKYDGIRMLEGFTLNLAFLLVEHQRGARHKSRSTKVSVDCCNMRVHGRRSPPYMGDDKRREKYTHCVSRPEPAVEENCEQRQEYSKPPSTGKPLTDGDQWVGNGHEAEWRKRQNCQRGDCGQLNEPAVIQQNPGKTAEHKAAEEEKQRKSGARVGSEEHGGTWDDAPSGSGVVAHGRECFQS